MSRKCVVLIDPLTGEIIYTRMEEMRRKILKAVIKGNTLNDGAPPFPTFLNEDNRTAFLDGAARLIAEFMTDRCTFEDLLCELKERVDRDLEKKQMEIRKAEFLCGETLPAKIKQRKLKKVDKCLDVERNRLPEPLMSLCNPNSKGWRKDENILISKLLVLYRKFTPLKKYRRIYANIALIFIACGLRPGAKNNDDEAISEALRRRRIKPAKAL